MPGAARYGLIALAAAAALGQNRCMKLKAQPERLSWHRVLIPASDVARLGAGGLLDNFEKAYRAVGVRQGVEVYHNEIDGAHVFFFSPQASAVAAHVLQQFGARRCIGAPDVSGCRRVPV
jgi:hypothetical protein